MIIIDASTALGWVMDERTTLETEAALDAVTESGDGLVPPNFIAEFINGLIRAERRKRIDQSVTSRAILQIEGLELSVDLPDPHKVAAIAREHQLTAYDASYLALAIQHRAPVCTNDATLARAARSQNLLWTPPKKKREK